MKLIIIPATALFLLFLLTAADALPLISCITEEQEAVLDSISSDTQFLSIFSILCSYNNSELNEKIEQQQNNTTKLSNDITALSNLHNSLAAQLTASNATHTVMNMQLFTEISLLKNNLSSYATLNQTNQSISNAISNISGTLSLYYLRPEIDANITNTTAFLLNYTGNATNNTRNEILALGLLDGIGYLRNASGDIGQLRQRMESIEAMIDDTRRSFAQFQRPADYVLNATTPVYIPQIQATQVQSQPLQDNSNLPLYIFIVLITTIIILSLVSIRFRNAFTSFSRKQLKHSLPSGLTDEHEYPSYRPAFIDVQRETEKKKTIQQMQKELLIKQRQQTEKQAEIDNIKAELADALAEQEIREKGKRMESESHAGKK